jgi:ElaA protein
MPGFPPGIHVFFAATAADQAGHARATRQDPIHLPLRRWAFSLAAKITLAASRVIGMIASPERRAWRSFAQLSAAELYSLLRLRCEVFVVEQQCAYPDIDGRDPEANHLLAWDSSGRLCACLRVFGPDGTDAARIGRVVTSSADRGAGLGRWLMQEALDFVAGRYGDVPIAISAQVYLERFYADFGFMRSSPDYLEDGILHCDMLRAPTQRKAGTTTPS